MTKLLSIFAVSAIALTSTAGIAGEPTQRFTHHGVTYVYDASPASDGSTVLTGHTLPSGSKFHLIVRDGQVTGHADRRPVSFSVAGSRGAASEAAIARQPLRFIAAN